MDTRPIPTIFAPNRGACSHRDSLRTAGVYSRRQYRLRPNSGWAQGPSLRYSLRIGGLATADNIALDLTADGLKPIRTVGACSRRQHCLRPNSGQPAFSESICPYAILVDACVNPTRLSSICPSLVLVDVGINPMLSLFPQFPLTQSP